MIYQAMVKLHVGTQDSLDLFYLLFPDEKNLSFKGRGILFGLRPEDYDSAL